VIRRFAHTNSNAQEITMARKIEVMFRGEVVGTRTTDRIYTHAIVAHDFNPDAYMARERERAQSASFRKSYESNHRHACEVNREGKAHKYASVISEKQFARYAETAAMSLEAYIEHEIADSLQRAQNNVAGKIGTVGVVCYCGRPDLAAKALSEHRGGPGGSYRQFSIAEVVEVAKPAKV
jgi:ABC-type proline/glycine betaine transport system ATPase subunit